MCAATNAPKLHWHWQHYHEPYEFGAKLPNFNDYETPTSNDADYAARWPPSPPLPPSTHHNVGAAIVDVAARQRAKSFDHLAQLSCDSGEMILRLNFSEPFKGIVYPDHNRLSPCRFFGDGHLNYELRLPLRGCGTRQVSIQAAACI